ncbi:glycosyltransferase [Paraflavitalea sp. CAU 1676]|uniref:glycosyltransferase family 2 protein n=1 Tax=Paraflavitalea sp. CAU 1676 TaxID=3032598 RepID=UPI0023DA905B|nr:glycosyltransferase [Paraflavitalea sp. CAU 1676]MDF2189655.1 glycosyltransferase [Paraflavitalea sp. CAU 1676]
MNQPLISVCIITYNHEKYIRQCLEGVVMQKTNFPFEVIVGEDCSKDGTRKIVEEFEAKYPDIIKPIYHSSNVGGARNGYEFCYPRLSGKYVAICEGDDYWTDNSKLQKQVDFLEKHEDHVMCFHRVQSVDENDVFIEGQEVSDKVMSFKGKDIFHISIPTLSVVFRKCFDVIPPEMFKAKSGDTFLFGLLARFGKAADLGFVGARYRKHSGGVYSPKSIVDQFAQAIETRKLMKQCSLFADEQKKEIGREILKRKILYFKYFLKRYEPLNSFKIIIR